MSVEPAWIDWTGGECPVDKNTPVEIQQRDTYLKDGKPRHFRFKTVAPLMFSWAHSGHDRRSDIIAYRVIPHPFAN